MSNIIQFRAQRHDLDTSIADCDCPAEIKSAALRASARTALSSLARQFELAIAHASEIELCIRDLKQRREYSDQIKRTRHLLDVVHLKIMQI